MQSGSAGSEPSPQSERKHTHTWHRSSFRLKQTTHVGGSQFLGQEWERAVNQWSGLVDRWATFPWLNTQRVGDTQSCSSLISRPLLTSCLFCHLTTLYTSSSPSQTTSKLTCFHFKRVKWWRSPSRRALQHGFGKNPWPYKKVCHMTVHVRRACGEAEYLLCGWLLSCTKCYERTSMAKSKTRDSFAWTSNEVSDACSLLSV